MTTPKLHADLTRKCRPDRSISFKASSQTHPAIVSRLLGLPWTLSVRHGGFVLRRIGRWAFAVLSLSYLGPSLALFQDVLLANKLSR
jgi:hypothetical protein